MGLDVVRDTGNLSTDHKEKKEGDLSPVNQSLPFKMSLLHR